MEHIDHAEEALRLIDRCLLEEETALAALKRWSEVHSVAQEQQDQLAYYASVTRNADPQTL